MTMFVFIQIIIATEDWVGPGGFSIFTGLYVAGVTCIIVPFLYSHLKNFQNEVYFKWLKIN